MPVPPQRRYTRVKPPEDVIGVKDRLAMLLEPPLEALLAGRAWNFPAQPFPFQMEGVAFLYPRHAALLADEMGLGKTMQAITAMRLLFHTRQIRRALVCPKPLVTNWQREFARWAPELPLVPIEGDRARRRWQWQQADCRCGSRNTRFCAATPSWLPTRALHFDLMVLDEVPADQESRRQHRASRCGRFAAAQLGADRHAGGKQPRRPGGHI